MPTGTQPEKITRRHVFHCLDGHTCGNPVRLVTSGHPDLKGKTMSERRQDFMRRFDWIRTALMFEPRGNDVMSGAFLYSPIRPECDTGIIYIEVSGCLPMCGHGTMGAVSFALEEGLLRPKKEGLVVLDAPAGVVQVAYRKKNGKVQSVRITNVPSFLAKKALKVEIPDLGELTVDIAYGGNFYAIIEPQPAYKGLSDLTALEIQRLSPIVRNRVNELFEAVHPENPTIRGVSHVMWTGKPKNSRADGRNAVFYGDKGIDRSPCGTGTSARMAQLAAKGELKAGDEFVHESLIGSLFENRVEKTCRVGDFEAIVPAVAGWAIQTGKNTIYVDPEDPFWKGFQVL